MGHAGHACESRVGRRWRTSGAGWRYGRGLAGRGGPANGGLGVGRRGWRGSRVTVRGLAWVGRWAWVGAVGGVGLSFSFSIED
ncbi:hypothetical protein HPP92_016605 [Vanilla planifolia]|uniref:Uncharacterized protein n=1 Tax=Vanilla planifolia TaxID=51239 RepID=A0A835QG07_VANPL|nr:hypothetical protein HPP92_016605 [Vanilla planifolia]